MRIAMAPDATQTPEDLEAVFREYAPMIYRTARMVTGSPGIRLQSTTRPRDYVVVDRIERPSPN